MKARKLITIAVFCVLVVLAAKDVIHIADYSKYINQKANVLITELDNKYYTPYSLDQYEKQKIALNFAMLGGNFRIGTLCVAESANISLNVHSRFGNARILIANDDHEVLYDEVGLGENAKVSLKSGNYRIYLVGSWFSGKAEIHYTAGQFQPDNGTVRPS